MNAKNLGHFIIGGSSPAGTGQLYGYLAQHPKLYLPQSMAPECHFFTRKARFEKGLDYYLETYFQGAKPDQWWGERSSHLISSLEAPKRIKSLLPKMKIIFVLRNPIERSLAHYRFTALSGFETLSFEEALKTESARMADETDSWKEVLRYAYLQRSRYGQEIERYLKVFDRSQIHLIRSENLRDHPQETMNEVFDFFGIMPIQNLRESNSFRSPDVIDPKKQSEFRKTYGSRLDQAIQKFREEKKPEDEFEQALAKNLTWEKPKLSKDSKAFLRQSLLSEIEKVEAQTGWDCSDWKE